MVDTIIERCEAQGLRLTEQRRTIARVLEDADDHPDVEEWMNALIGKGWTVPAWPAEYGGGGLSADEVQVLKEEMSAIGTYSPLFSYGMSMLGPALLEYATEEEQTTGPCRVLRRNGVVRLQVNWDHPDAIATLFALYHSGAPEEGRLALEELDQLYGARAQRRAASRDESRGIFDGLLKSNGRVAEPDAEAQRVEIYEELWRADRRR